MGLLDMFDDPSTQLGMGLLAAASPRADAAGLGQRMMEGVQSAQGMRDAAMRRQLQQIQYQTALQDANFMQGVYGQINGQPSPVGQSSAPVGGTPLMGGAAPNASAMNEQGTPQTSQSANGFYGLNHNQLVGAALGGKGELAKAIVARNTPNWVQVGNKFVNTNDPTFAGGGVDKLTVTPDGKGVIEGADGSVRLAPGSLDAYTAFAKAGADVAANNEVITVPVKGEDGQTRNVQMTKAAFLASQKPQQTAPVVAPQPGYDTNHGLDMSRVSPETFKLMSSQDPAALLAGVRRFQANNVIPSAPPASGTQIGVAESPTETALNIANVKLKTEPAIKSATDIAGGDASNFTTYKNGLNKAVDEGFNQYQRNALIRGLMQDYQTGLPSADARAAFAGKLKNTFPGNSTVASFANSIAGGDVGNAQQMANILSAAGLTNVIRTLDGNGRVNKAEYAALQEHAEKNTSDPAALEGIMSYQDQIYKQQLNEQQQLNSAIKANKIDPRTWQADFSQYRHENMAVPKTPAQASASTGPQPLPPNPTAQNLVKGQTYKTRHGNLVWNGMQFIGQ